jgi:hypothetical protein
MAKIVSRKDEKDDLKCPVEGRYVLPNVPHTAFLDESDITQSVLQPLSLKSKRLSGYIFILFKAGGLGVC